jgi:hypothetical protein
MDGKTASGGQLAGHRTRPLLTSNSTLFVSTQIERFLSLKPAHNPTYPTNSALVKPEIGRVCGGFCSITSKLDVNGYFVACIYKHSNVSHE